MFDGRKKEVAEDVVRMTEARCFSEHRNAKENVRNEETNEAHGKAPRFRPNSERRRKRECKEGGDFCGGRQGDPPAGGLGMSEPDGDAEECDFGEEDVDAEVGRVVEECVKNERESECGNENNVRKAKFHIVATYYLHKNSAIDKNLLLSCLRVCLESYAEAISEKCSGHYY